MRPTIKDLARAAGVSLATVDRVLNDRPNVSQKTVTKVHAAIERIGFVRNMSAVNLARKTTYRFLFILPDTGDQFLDVIAREIAEASAALNVEFVEASVERIPIEDAHRVANYIAALSQDKVRGVAIMAPESPQVRDAIARLRQRGIAAVNFLSGRSIAGEANFVGINNRAAGATAARLIGKFGCGRRGKVLVIAETMRARDSTERRLGFDDVINQDFHNLFVLPSLETHADASRTQRILEHTFAHNSDIIAVYVMSSEARIPLSAIGKYTQLQKLVIVAHERTPFTISRLRNGSIDAIIAQHAGHAVRSAIRILRAQVDNREIIGSQDRLRIEILLKDNVNF